MGSEIPPPRATEASPAPSTGLQLADMKEFSPPARVELTAQAGSSPASRTAYVDIGHCTSGEKEPGGKHDYGFQSENYTECQVNTAVGKKLMAELQKEGIRVVPTWDPNRPPPVVSKAEDLQRRNDKVNKDVALNCDDSIYVSVHHDNDSSRKSGQCVYIADPKYNESLPLAKSIQSNAWRIRERDSAPACINSDKVTNNGKLVGLRGVNSVGVLVEGANVTNPTDKALMNDPRFHDLEAKRIAKGVVDYFKLKPGVERPQPACRRSI